MEQESSLLARHASAIGRLRAAGRYDLVDRALSLMTPAKGYTHGSEVLACVEEVEALADRAESNLHRPRQKAHKPTWPTAATLAPFVYTGDDAESFADLDAEPVEHLTGSKAFNPRLMRYVKYLRRPHVAVADLEARLRAVTQALQLRGGGDYDDLRVERMWNLQRIAELERENAELQELGVDRSLGQMRAEAMVHEYVAAHEAHVADLTSKIAGNEQLHANQTTTIKTLQNHLEHARSQGALGYLTRAREPSPQAAPSVGPWAGPDGNVYTSPQPPMLVGPYMVLPEVHQAALKEIANLQGKVAAFARDTSAAVDQVAELKLQLKEFSDEYEEENVRADQAEAESYKKDVTIKKLKQGNDKLTAANKAAMYTRMAADAANDAQIASLNRTIASFCEEVARNNRECKEENTDD